MNIYIYTNEAKAVVAILRLSLHPYISHYIPRYVHADIYIYICIHVMSVHTYMAFICKSRPAIPVPGMTSFASSGRKPTFRKR